MIFIKDIKPLIIIVTLSSCSFIKKEANINDDLNVYKNNCLKKELSSCHNFAYKIQERDPQNTEIKEYYRIACEGGYIRSCGNLANIERKLGNKENARKYYAKACDEISMYCNDQGLLETEMQNTIEAMKAYRKACLQGQMLGCFNLGYEEDKQGNFEIAKKLYQQACSGGEHVGCHNLSILESEIKTSQNTDNNQQQKLSLHKQDPFLKKFEKCMTEDIIMFLPLSGYAGYGMDKKTLYMGWLDLIQKTSGGYLAMTKFPKGAGIGHSTIFVKLNPFWKGREFSGWLYLTGTYKYIGIDGFENSVPMFKAYEGHLRMDSCKEGTLTTCHRRNGRDCF